MDKPITQIPFTVQVKREWPAWLVVARNHSWLHGSWAAALREALDLAAGFDVRIEVQP